MFMEDTLYISNDGRVLVRLIGNYDDNTICMKVVNNKLLLKMAHFFTEMESEQKPMTVMRVHWWVISRNIGDIADNIRLI